MLWGLTIVLRLLRAQRDQGRPYSVPTMVTSAYIPVNTGMKKEAVGRVFGYYISVVFDITASPSDSRLPLPRHSCHSESRADFETHYGREIKDFS